MSGFTGLTFASRKLLILFKFDSVFIVTCYNTPQPVAESYIIVLTTASGGMDGWMDKGIATGLYFSSSEDLATVPNQCFLPKSVIRTNSLLFNT